MAFMTTRSRSRQVGSQPLPVTPLITKPRVTKPRVSKKQQTKEAKEATIPSLSSSSSAPSSRGSIKKSIMAKPSAPAPKPSSAPVVAADMMGGFVFGGSLGSLYPMTTFVVNTCKDLIEVAYATDDEIFKSWDIYATVFASFIDDKFTALLANKKLNFPYRNYLANALVSELQGDVSLINSPNYAYSRMRAQLAEPRPTVNLQPEQVPHSLFHNWLGLKQEAVATMVWVLLEIIKNPNSTILDWVDSDQMGFINKTALVNNAKFDIQLLIASARYAECFKAPREVLQYIRPLTEILEEPLSDFLFTTLKFVEKSSVREVLEMGEENMKSQTLLYRKDSVGGFYIATNKDYDF